MPKTRPFDQYSDEYDAWYDDHSDLYGAELEAIRQLIPSGQAVGLEVGIGTGRFALPLGVRVGVEPSEAMAEKARRRGLEVYPGVAEKLPFADEMFDYILMVTTICFVDDVVISIREARRVLKPSGCLIIGLVDKESELGKQYERIKNEDKFYREATFFSSSEVIEYLSQAGFTDICAKQTMLPGEQASLVAEGYGQGSFVAIRGDKIAQHDKLWRH